MNADKDDMEITLPILRTIEQQSDITQRSLAKRLDLALGLTNAYLKNLVRKGLVKIEQIPANRYLYYLTPKGLTEKGRLTAAYLSKSLHFYRHASHAYKSIFQNGMHNNWSDVILGGVSDLAEIALLHAQQANITIKGIYDPDYGQTEFMNHPVINSVEAVPVGIPVVITSLDVTSQAIARLLRVTDKERIFIPDILQ